MPATTANLISPDISCMHCVMTVKNGIVSMPGVYSVDANPETKEVTVNYDSDKVSIEDIKAKLAELGYPAQD
ncbi:MAG: heavy-metal-associated domain-containing protein [Firmicutes bacterium]|nr:heavy-metal-associated domain-containing protein [Bacillota bacterium]